MSTATKEITAEELLEMGDIGPCELIYGELVMMSPAGTEHGIIASRLARYVGNYAEENRLGEVPIAEAGYKLASNPDLVRTPDASFIRASRLHGRSAPFFTGPPDLAIEVISPSDSRRMVAEKVNTWLAHGTVSVWVADPKAMTTMVHRTGEKPVVYRLDQTLTDEAVLPGFSLAMSRVFAAIG